MFTGLEVGFLIVLAIVVGVILPAIHFRSHDAPEDESVTEGSAVDHAPSRLAEMGTDLDRIYR